MRSTSADDASPGFDLVRRGYDPHQVTAHVNWLVEELKNAESHRAATEAELTQKIKELRDAEERIANLERRLRLVEVRGEYPL